MRRFGASSQIPCSGYEPWLFLYGLLFALVVGCRFASKGVRFVPRHNTADTDDDDARDHGDVATMRVVHRRGLGTTIRVHDFDDDDDARGRQLGACVHHVWMRERSRRRTRGSDGKRARAAVRDDDGGIAVDVDAVGG